MLAEADASGSWLVVPGATGSSWMGAQAEFRARLGYAAQQVVEALTILVDAHGAGSFAESSQLQQYWRDANTAARHAGLQPTVGYEVYGKSTLGVPERISFTV